MIAYFTDSNLNSWRTLQVSILREYMSNVNKQSYFSLSSNHKILNNIMCCFHGELHAVWVRSIEHRKTARPLTVIVQVCYYWHKIYVHTFLTSNFSVLLLITNVKTRTKAHCLARWLRHTDVKHTEFINDFKVTKTKEMAKTVLLIIDSFQISMFMTGENTVKTKILILHAFQLILHLHTV